VAVTDQHREAEPRLDKRKRRQKEAEQDSNRVTGSLQVMKGGLLEQVRLGRSWDDGRPEEPRRPQKEAEDKDSNRVIGSGKVLLKEPWGNGEPLKLCQSWS
jgi:hypothetical protein